MAIETGNITNGGLIRRVPGAQPIPRNLLGEQTTAPRTTTRLQAEDLSFIKPAQTAGDRLRSRLIQYVTTHVPTKTISSDSIAATSLRSREPNGPFFTRFGWLDFEAPDPAKLQHLADEGDNAAKAALLKLQEKHEGRHHATGPSTAQQVVFQRDQREEHVDLMARVPRLSQLMTRLGFDDERRRDIWRRVTRRPDTLRFQTNLMERQILRSAQ